MSDTFSFHTPTYEDAAWCIPLLKEAPSPCCEYSFANMMAWHRHFDTKIALVEECVVVRFGGDSPHYLAPAGRDTKRALNALHEDARVNGKSLYVFGYDEEGVDRLSQEYTVTSREEYRDEFDYLYRIGDLAELAGRKYHAKRNHIAAFSREHVWRYEEIKDENAADVIRAADLWCKQRITAHGDVDGALQAENKAIRELLAHRRETELCGGLLRVNDDVVAFTFGAPLTDDTFDTLVEKALTGYEKAYAVINREFARHTIAGYTYVNRENDVGAEGLRRAKLSYHPVSLVKKILCTLE